MDTRIIALYMYGNVLVDLTNNVNINSLTVKDYQTLEDVYDYFIDLNDVWDELSHETIWIPTFDVFPINWEVIYHAFAYCEGLQRPVGKYDRDYGFNNIPYLWDAWINSTWEEPNDWTYRLYVPFAGPAPEGTPAFLHCHSSWRFVDQTDDRYEDLVDYREVEITRQRSRRYA